MRPCSLLITLLLWCLVAGTGLSAATASVLDANGDVVGSHATIAGALAALPSSPAGYTVSLSSGTFSESVLLHLPPGVDLIGAGAGATTIASTVYTTTTGTFDPDAFAIQARSTSMTAGDQTITGFTIDGASRQVLGGLFVEGRSGVMIEDVSTNDLGWAGIWLDRVEQCAVLGGTLSESSWGSDAYSSGALNIGTAVDVLVQGLTITSLGDGTGYGIKSLPLSEDVGETWDRVVIDGCDIDLRVDGAWNNGQAPNIAIEAHDMTLSNCRITNCELVNNVSVPSRSLGDGTPSMRIDHNTFELLDGSGNYGIELSTSDMQIDHNYFRNGSYAFAHWGDNRPLANITIHRNIIRSKDGMRQFYIKEQIDGFTVTHNVFHKATAYYGAAVFDLHKNQTDGASSDWLIANNLFLIDGGSASELLVQFNNGATLSGLQVRDNWLQRITVGSPAGTWSGNLIGNTIPIQQSGAYAGDWCRPQSDGALIDAGTAIGEAYAGSAPDIGRWETPPPRVIRMQVIEGYGWTMAPGPIDATPALDDRWEVFDPVELDRDQTLIAMPSGGA